MTVRFFERDAENNSDKATYHAKKKIWFIRTKWKKLDSIEGVTVWYTMIDIYSMMLFLDILSAISIINYSI